MEYLLFRVLEDSKRLLKKLKTAPRSFFFILIGIFIIGLGISRYYKIRTLSFTKSPTEVKTISQGALPSQITIPSINIDLPVDVGEIKNGVWQISKENTTFLNISAKPGMGGNVVIYGHNKKSILGNLPYLSLGQKIFIKTTDNKVYAYEAYRKDFVGPDKVELISPTDHEELTIFTCWGIIDQQRVVIKAKPLF